jgi:protein required for attachment to host cells
MMQSKSAMQASIGGLVNPTRTCVLITDGGRARIMEYDNGVHATGDTDRVADQRTSKNHPRRIPNAANHVEPRVNPLQGLTHLFLCQLTAFLAKHHRDGRFDRLVLVAPSEILSNLRQSLDSRLRTALVAEIGEDLTAAASEQIRRRIDATLRDGDAGLRDQVSRMK